MVTHALKHAHQAFSVGRLVHTACNTCATWICPQRCVYI